ncbi:MAG: TIGR02757 family protein [Planctomycetes bacterium]|nr:TIGR02757 family protein [Planctomycetota bacterium]
MISKASLDRFLRAWPAADRLRTDPLSRVRRYPDPADREVAGLFAAALAYGQVGVFLRNIDRLLTLMGPSPAAWVRGFDPSRDLRPLAAFRHRRTGWREVAHLGWALRSLLERYGSLRASFLRGVSPGDADIRPGLSEFVRAIRGVSPRPVTGRARESADFRFWLPSPDDGSACKRWNLYLRWMVRPDDGIDCGCWPEVGTRRLVVPLDVHLHRIARRLGLTRRRTADWTTAREITDRLRRFDPDDPVKYDFALCHVGIAREDPARWGLLEMDHANEYVGGKTSAGRYPIVRLPL